LSGLLDPPYALDSGGMIERIEELGYQIDEALARGAAEAWCVPAAPITLLAVGAMGGSAIAADLSSDVWIDRLPRPILTVRDYHWPACVARGTLAVLCSYSGNTEETLSLYREAGSRGVVRAAISSGGTLTHWCDRDRVAISSVPGGSPPRAALFGVWVALSGILRGLGWIEDPTLAWREASATLRERTARLGASLSEATNPLKQLARTLSGKQVFVYAGAARTGAVATRVRNQINENAKLLGHSALVPELNHNEIVGWEKSGPMSREPAVLLLRDREESPEVTRRLDLTGEMARSMGADVHEWHSVGEGRLARIASLVQFGDYLSFYLALLNGVDPTPVTSIDEFKRRLSAR